MPDTAESIKEKITLAFKEAPFPIDGYDIYAAQTDDDYGSPRFTTEHLPGRKWFEVSSEQLDDCYTALTYLRPDGWRHYLPAWIVREIDHPYKGIDKLLWTLRKPEGEIILQAKEKHNSLSPVQIEAIISYLEYYQKREKNTHATHANHRYAAGGIKWTEELEPWRDQEKIDGLIAYWKSCL